MLRNFGRWLVIQTGLKEPFRVVQCLRPFQAMEEGKVPLQKKIKRLNHKDPNPRLHVEAPQEVVEGQAEVEEEVGSQHPDLAWKGH